MKLRLAQWMVMVLVFAFGGLSAFAQANGPQGCGVQSLQGSYAFRSQGTAPGGIAILFVGVNSLDGKGSGSGSNTGSVDGSVFRDTLNMSYSVNSDCTGTMTVLFPWGSVHWDIVIADNGKKFLGIISDPGFSVSMEAIKQ